VVVELALDYLVRGAQEERADVGGDRLRSRLTSATAFLASPSARIAGRAKVAADLEVLHRALGLGTPVAVPAATSIFPLETDSVRMLGMALLRAIGAPRTGDTIACL
jgi:hypothetical protein